MIHAVLYVPTRALPADFEQQKFKLRGPSYDDGPLFECEFEARLSELDGAWLECELLPLKTSCQTAPSGTHFSIVVSGARLYGHIIEVESECAG